MNSKKLLQQLLSINNSHKLSMQALITAFTSSILSYYLLIINGYTNPDGICEGLTFYKNADWALAGCGRWAIRYMNEFSCNIISPLLVVIGYTLCIWLSIVFLAKIWKMSNEAIIILSAIMMVTPTVTEQITYTYTAMAYALSCLFSILAIYFIFNHKVIAGFIGSTISVTLMLGLYQTYVGMVAVLFTMTLIIKLLTSIDLRQLVKPVLVGISSCLSSVLINGQILNIEIQKRGLNSSGTRISEFEISTIFDSFSESFPYVYQKYISFFQDSLMHRNVLYNGVLIIIAILLVLYLIQLIKNKKYIHSILAILFILLIPFMSNLIGILIPYNGVGSIMRYQSILILPFMFACMEQFTEYKSYFYLRSVAIFLSFILCWTYILAANATLKCYDLSYKHINSQMQIAISRVYDLENYKKDITPIIIAGFPSDSTLKNNMDIYKYAENLHDNPAFWENMHGASNNRYLYFMNYFGIDSIRFQDEDYETIVNSPEFSNMPIWPDAGSVQMIHDFAVIKFSEEPPMP